MMASCEEFAVVICVGERKREREREIFLDHMHSK